MFHESKRECPSLHAIQQVSTYLSVLFDPTDLVEIRAVDCSETKSRLVHRNFLSPSQVLERLPRITQCNLSGNEIFIGVCPRSRRAGTRDAVHVAKCVWVDLDNVTPNDAQAVWEGILPPPSMVVASSDSGTHAFWKLENVVDVSTPESKVRFEQILKNLYNELGSDTVWDLARVLRLPSKNFKAYHRYGHAPQDCRVVYASERTYPLKTFRPWFFANLDKTELGARKPLQMPVEISRDIAAVVRRLDWNVADRSKRDFAVVRDLLQLGLNDKQIWQLVSPKSKFQERGREYFVTTLRNAQQRDR